MKIIFLRLLVLLALTSLACSLSLDLPASQPGELRTVTIDEQAPEDGETARVWIEMAGGILEITGGGDGLISGTIEYNLEDWTPEVQRDENTVRIHQDVRSIPIPRRGSNVTNRWDLRLGDTPMELQIDAGAYEGTLDLSGVPLTRFSLSSGASNTIVRFEEPNPERMMLMEFQTGASNVELIGLGNANFDEMRFRGAAGNYTLDFSGEQLEDANAAIEGAVGDLTIIVPDDRPVRATVTGGLRNIDTEGTWDISDDTYTTGNGEPVLEISINMSVGNLTLISR